MEGGAERLGGLFFETQRRRESAEGITDREAEKRVT